MAEHDRDFPPEMPDEAIEQHLSQLSGEDEQLVRALREQYSLTRAHQARALAHGWERIQQAQQPATPFARKTRQDALVPAQDEIKRTLHMREIPSGTRQLSRLKRTLNILVAAILLAVVAGSLALVYSHLSPQTRVGSGNSGFVTPTQAGTTPTRGGVTPQPTGALPTVEGTQIVVTNGQQSLNWPVGKCTYWANLRYHQLTGYWVAWTGNADEWVTGARQAGWHVSTSPHVPSIVVLMPYVQGADEYGQVGVVESLVNSTTAHTSNMDWYINGGSFDKVSYANITDSTGIYFIWHS
jgi:surface antigen